MYAILNSFNFAYPRTLSVNDGAGGRGQGGCTRKSKSTSPAPWTPWESGHCLIHPQVLSLVGLQDVFVQLYYTKSNSISKAKISFRKGQKLIMTISLYFFFDPTGSFFCIFLYSFPLLDTKHLEEKEPVLSSYSQSSTVRVQQLLFF